MGWRFAVQGGTQHGLDEGTIDLGLFHAQDAGVTRSTAAWNISQGWAGVSGDGTHEVTDGDKDGIVDQIGTYFNAEAGYIPNDYQVQDIRLYAVTSAGVAATAPDIYSPTSTMQGSDSAAWPGPSNALVISTATATLGRKGRGRWYLGPVSNIYGADGLVPGSIRTAAVTAAATMFDNIRNIGSAASARYAPVVWHRGTTTASVIKSLRVGDEIDQQQRRRRQRAETYTSQALA
ncbi:MAG: hypothetical protein ACOYBR_11070, partial [Fluviibacter sp.]